MYSKTKTRTKPAGRSVCLTKREAEALMAAVDMAVHVYGTPDCPKCERSLFSAVRKLDVTFSLGVTDESQN